MGSLRIRHNEAIKVKHGLLMTGGMVSLKFSDEQSSTERKKERKKEEVEEVCKAKVRVW